MHFKLGVFISFFMLTSNHIGSRYPDYVQPEATPQLQVDQMQNKFKEILINGVFQIIHRFAHCIVCQGEDLYPFNPSVIHLLIYLFNQIPQLRVVAEFILVFFTPYPMYIFNSYSPFNIPLPYFPGNLKTTPMAILGSTPQTIHVQFYRSR